LLLADDRANEAADLAVAAVAMLEQIAPRAAQLDPNLGALYDQLEQVRGNVLGATTGSR
jgi:type IV secretory pathway VirB2 component (pilin)